MSLFCIIARDVPQSAAKRELHFDAHLKYLQKLNAQKRLLAAGPLFSGVDADTPACASLFIVEFDSLHDAKTWFEQDAYYQAGVYHELEIKPYIDAMPYC